MKGKVYYKPTDDQCVKCIQAHIGKSTPPCVDMDADYYGEGKCAIMTHFDTEKRETLISLFEHI